MKHIIVLVIWALNASAQWSPNGVNDNIVMVQLFEWKWADVAEECERYLGPLGFTSVQVSPPQEHIKRLDPFRPWWERYQVMGYELIGRSGNEAEFSDMVKRCNDAGVRIYVDAVINHMAFFCGEENIGTAGNICVTGESYPVPYNASHFNKALGLCPTENGEISDMYDVNEVRNCDLLGLQDLAQSLEYVQDRIVEYLQRCIDHGVAGFRVDASKHMWPDDLAAIFGSLSDLQTNSFLPNTRAFVAHEVVAVDGEPVTTQQYTSVGRVTEFKFGFQLSEGIRGKIPLSSFSDFSGEGWGMLESRYALVFIDNHDTQRGDPEIITYKEPALYKMAVAFMLAWQYGFPRIMSSYAFDNKDDSPPCEENGDIISPIINTDGSCGNGWICEHRWRAIRNMVEFRQVAGDEAVANWWDDGDQQIAFGRGAKAFIAINSNRNRTLKEKLQTGLPEGKYCNIIMGDWSDETCTGPTISVDGNGFADFDIENGEDPVAAIHVGAMSSGNIFKISFICIILSILVSEVVF